MDASVVDAASLARTFPEPPSGEVTRSNVVDTISQLFDDSDCEVVLVGGREGVGKTTLLAQFVRQHAERAISLFMRPLSSLATDPMHIMSDLAGQAHYILYNEIRKEEPVDELTYRALLTSLQAMARKTSKQGPIYFVVDGLDEFDESQRVMRDELVWRLLPFGNAGFRFVIAGNVSSLPDSVNRHAKSCHFPVPLLAYEEAKRMLFDFDLSEAQLVAIYDESRKLPGLVASFGRELRAGRSVDDLLQNVPQDLHGFIEREWCDVDLSSEPAATFLGLIAFAQQPYTLPELGLILKVEVGSLGELVKRIPVIQVSAASGHVRFATEAHRRHAASLLKSRREEILDIFIRHLGERRELEASQELFSYLRAADRNGELVAAVTGEFLRFQLNKTASFFPVLRRVQEALSAAVRLDDKAATLRFSILAAALRDLDGSPSIQAHVDALCSLGDLDRAITVAQSTPIREDRASALARVANAMKRQGDERHDGLAQEVESIVTALLDEGAVFRGLKLRQLVRELFDVAPALATRVIRESRTQQLDRRLDGSALPNTEQIDADGAAYEREPGTQPEGGRDNELEAALKAATRFSRNKPAAEILTLVDGIDAEGGIFYLLRWLQANANQPGALGVAEHCLDLLVDTTEHVPTSRDFRIVGRVIAEASVHNPETARRMIRRIDGLSHLARERSASVEHVHLAMNLVRAEMNLARCGVEDHQAPLGRLARLLQGFSNVSDDATRAQGMARILVELSALVEERSDLQPALKDVLDLVHHDLEELVSGIVSNTANHHELLAPVLASLAKSDPMKASSIVDRMNTQYRRDRALALLADQLSTGQTSAPLLEWAFTFVRQIDHPNSRDGALLSIAENLDEDVEELSGAELEALRRQYSLLKSLPDPFSAALVLSRLASVVGKVGGEDTVRLAKWSVEAIGRIASPAVRFSLVHEVARNLAKAAPDQARALLDDAERERRDDPSISSDAHLVRNQLLALATRAYSGLVRKGVSRMTHFEWIEDAVSGLQSSGASLHHWAQLAMACLRAEDLDEASAIVKRHVLPAAHALSTDDDYTRNASCGCRGTSSFDATAWQESGDPCHLHLPPTQGRS